MAETHQADMAGQLARWKARGKAQAAQQEAHASRLKVIQLPLWPETKRGATQRGAARVRFSRPSRARAASTCAWIVNWWPPRTRH